MCAGNFLEKKHIIIKSGLSFNPKYFMQNFRQFYQEC